MANTPNLVIQASDWLKGCGFQISYDISMLIGSVKSLIIITSIDQGENECSNDGTSQV